MSEPWSDEELGAELAPDDPIAGTELAKLMREKSPANRAAMQHLVEIGRDLRLYETGLGPKPQGVIVCRPHRRSERP